MADIEVRTSGSAVTMSTADRIVIRLPENATTGYQWSIAQLGEPLEVVSNEMIPPGQMAAGAAGERVVIIKPRGPGHAKLRLELKRAWERDPIEQFEADVQVTGP
jgi:inhibitor of cysteine peptidase